MWAHLGQALWVWIPPQLSSKPVLPAVLVGRDNLFLSCFSLVPGSALLGSHLFVCPTKPEVESNHPKQTPLNGPREQLVSKGKHSCVTRRKRRLCTWEEISIKTLSDLSSIWWPEWSFPAILNHIFSLIKSFLLYFPIAFMVKLRKVWTALQDLASADLPCPASLLTELLTLLCLEPLRFREYLMLDCVLHLLQKSCPCSLPRKHLCLTVRGGELGSNRMPGGQQRGSHAQFRIVRGLWG